MNINENTVLPGFIAWLICSCNLGNIINALSGFISLMAFAASIKANKNSGLAVDRAETANNIAKKANEIAEKQLNLSVAFRLNAINTDISNNKPINLDLSDADNKRYFVNNIQFLIEYRIMFGNVRFCQIKTEDNEYYDITNTKNITFTKRITESKGWHVVYVVYKDFISEKYLGFVLIFIDQVIDQENELIKLLSSQLENGMDTNPEITRTSDLVPHGSLIHSMMGQDFSQSELLAGKSFSKKLNYFGNGKINIDPLELNKKLKQFIDEVKAEFE